MEEMLLYDSESLNLSTLKVQIVGKDKPLIMEFLHNVEDLEEAFEVLDSHYGDIRTIIPRMKKQINLLGNYPKNKKDENKNIQKILNFYKRN